MSDDPVSGVFGRPFTEQVAFFRRKLGNLVPTEFWDDMLREEHDRGFMVAGAAKADLLTDLAAAVDKAIAEGRGIEEFRRDFDAIVRRHGWTGWTGQGTVQGEAWRVKTILRTNSYTSYAAGRLAQLRASNFKWWIYRHGGSEEPRPQHLSWDGLVLPPDHPFWDKFYPPSDWGCSCYVIGANSNAAVRRGGGKPDKKLPDGWDSIDPKTGAPEGIGRGWDYAPGASASGEVSAIAGKVRLWDQQVSKAFMAALPPGRADELADAYRRLPSTADDLRRYAQRVEEGSAAGDENRRPLPPVRTLGLVRTDQAERLASLKDGLDVSGFDYVIDTELSAHIFNRHGKRSKDPFPIEPSDFALLPAIASNPDEIELGRVSRLGNLQRVIMRKAIGGVMYELVWEVRSGRRSLYLKSFLVKRRERG